MSGVRAVTSPLLAQAKGVRHAFFTRQGGVSEGIYASLNLGRGSRDDPAAVAENRRRAAEQMGVEPGALLACFQIHSATVHVAEGPWGDEPPEGDGVVTATRGVACGALAADCAPILLADVRAGVVGAAHAGWKGALGGVAEAAVEAMVGLGAGRDRICAAVGPCIGPASYEVGGEFESRFTATASGYGRYFRAAAEADKRMFDLPGFVLDRLAAAGVTRTEWVGHDTCAEEALFFSNRRAFKRGEPDYGRLLSSIVLD